MLRFCVEMKQSGDRGAWCKSFAEAAWQAIAVGAEMVELDLYGPVVRYDIRVMEIISERVEENA